MKSRSSVRCAIALLLLVSSLGWAQPAAVLLTRQEWMSQLQSSDPVPLLHLFYAQMLGLNFTGGTVASPAAPAEPLAMIATPETLVFSRPYPPLSLDSPTETIVTGAEQMAAEFPNGTYQLKAEYTLGMLGTRTRTYDLSYTSDFPVTKPAIANLTPLHPIENAQQAFSWSGFEGSGGDYALFVLLEGDLTQDALQELSSLETADVLAALQEYLRVAYPASAQEIPTAKLPVSAQTVTVSGLDPAKDHLAVLIYGKVQAKQTGVEILSEQVGSISGNVTYYPRITEGFWGMPVDWGLRTSETLGWYYDALHPWIYQYGLGWVYSAGTSSDNLWLYSLDLGWIWTSANSYPYFYDLEEGWGYNTPHQVSPRQYYFFSSNKFQEVP